MPVYESSGATEIAVDDFDSSEVINIAVVHVRIVPVFDMLGAPPPGGGEEVPPGGFDSGFDSGFGGSGFA